LKKFWAIVALLVVIVLLIRFWFVALILAGVAALAIGLVALVRGNAYKVRSRTAGAVVLTVSLVALGIGGAGAAAAIRPSDNLNETASTRVEAGPRKATATPTPVREIKTIEENVPVAFTSSTVDDGDVAQGTVITVTPGVNGQRTITYEIIYEDGVEVERKTIGDVLSIAPVNEVIANGTYAPPAPVDVAPVDNGCHPSYADECVPYASDADCAAGSGDGPAYVNGPVRVVGPDEYDLDRDGDGIACDA
jgi:hypothetical protein